MALYAPVIEMFRRFDQVFAEVPFFGKSIDLVFATPTLARLYAVEMKLQDWRSAFKQAAINQLAAQQSFVAVPARLARTLADRERQLFNAYDVGLISVDKKATIVIPATRNGYFSGKHFRTLKQTLTDALRTQKPQTMGALTNALTKRSRTLVLLQVGTD
jgi:hypothetical protein